MIPEEPASLFLGFNILHRFLLGRLREIPYFLQIVDHFLQTTGKKFLLPIATARKKNANTLEIFQSFVMARCCSIFSKRVNNRVADGNMVSHYIKSVGLHLHSVRFVGFVRGVANRPESNVQSYLRGNAKWL